MPSDKTPRRITAKRRERMVRALDMRRAGLDYRTIGKELGISHVQAQHDVRDALREITREPAEEVRQLALERLDRMLLAHYPKAIKGDGPATDRVLRLEERRAKLLALDAPQTADVTGGIVSKIDQMLADAPQEPTT